MVKQKILLQFLCSTYTHSEQIIAGHQNPAVILQRHRGAAFLSHISISPHQDLSLDKGHGISRPRQDFNGWRPSQDQDQGRAGQD